MTDGDLNLQIDIAVYKIYVGLYIFSSILNNLRDHELHLPKQRIFDFLKNKVKQIDQLYKIKLNLIFWSFRFYRFFLHS